MYVYLRVCVVQSFSRGHAVAYLHRSVVRLFTCLVASCSLMSSEARRSIQRCTSLRPTHPCRIGTHMTRPRLTCANRFFSAAAAGGSDLLSGVERALRRASERAEYIHAWLPHCGPCRAAARRSRVRELFLLAFLRRPDSYPGPFSRCRSLQSRCRRCRLRALYIVSRRLVNTYLLSHSYCRDLPK